MSCSSKGVIPTQARFSQGMINTTRSPPKFDGDKTTYFGWQKIISYILQLEYHDEIGVTSSPVKKGAYSITNSTLTHVYTHEMIRKAALVWTASVDATSFAHLVNKIFDYGFSSEARK